MRKGWENVCNMNENTSVGAHLRTHRLVVVVVAVFAPTDADERSEAWEEILPLPTLGENKSESHR